MSVRLIAYYVFVLFVKAVTILVEKIKKNRPRPSRCYSSGYPLAGRIGVDVAFNTRHTRIQHSPGSNVSGHYSRAVRKRYRKNVGRSRLRYPHPPPAVRRYVARKRFGWSAIFCKIGERSDAVDSDTSVTNDISKMSL